MGAAIDRFFSAIYGIFAKTALIMLAMTAGIGVLHILTILNFLPQIIGG